MPDALAATLCTSTPKNDVGMGSRALAADQTDRRWAWRVFNHLKKHTGTGIVCAVAYFDPGNWGVDLQAGSQFGYKLLFVVLLAGALAAFLQVLASRLGCVTGLDLASHCRLLLHSRPKHTRLCRYILLYPLYVLTEIAMIATDLAELIGSAIAITMIFPACPIWVGVIVTAFDVLFVLALGDPLGGKPLKSFELIIAALVFAVLICMCILISRISIDWSLAFRGYIPSKAIFTQMDGIYLSTAIIGATVMPHSLFLGSALATQDRESSQTKEVRNITQRIKHKYSWKTMKGLFKVEKVQGKLAAAKSHKDLEPQSSTFVKQHLNHGIIDVVASLLCFAVVINSLILILAGAVFYYNNEQEVMHISESGASLNDAYDLLRTIVGRGAGYLFAFGLLAAGQSSSIIATVAGQAVSEGFLNWRVSPVLRRVLTRLLSLIPALIVAIAVGPSGINNLLIVSQVMLAIVLPFVVFPLVWLTSSREIMTASSSNSSPPPIPESLSLSRISSVCPSAEPLSPGSPPLVVPASLSPLELKSPTPLEPTSPAPPVMEMDIESQRTLSTGAEQKVDYSNGWIVTIMGYSIWLLVVIANIYVLSQLGNT